MRLLYPSVRHLMGLSLPLSGYTGNNRWQLNSKTEKVPSLSPGRGTLTNKWLLKIYLSSPGKPLHSYPYLLMDSSKFYGIQFYQRVFPFQLHHSKFATNFI